MPLVVPIVVFLLLAIQEAQRAAGVEKALIRHSKGCRANINVVEKDQPIHIKALHSAAHVSKTLQDLCTCLFHLTALFSVEPPSFAEAFHDLSGKRKSPRGSLRWSWSLWRLQFAWMLKEKIHQPSLAASCTRDSHAWSRSLTSSSKCQSKVALTLTGDDCSTERRDLKRKWGCCCPEWRSVNF